MQAAFRCMGIRGQEIWTGPHRQTEGKPSLEDLLRGSLTTADAVAHRKVR